MVHQAIKTCAKREMGEGRREGVHRVGEVVADGVVLEGGGEEGVDAAIKKAIKQEVSDGRREGSGSGCE
jgi:hypothetical protein